MSTLDTIPVTTEVATGNVEPLLHEIRHALTRLTSGKDGTTIDLKSLPLAPGEEERIEATLGTGEVRAASGTTITGIVPTNTYPCSDGKYVVIGGNGDSIFVRLMQAMGRDDLAADPTLADNAGRVAAQEMLDRVIADWTASLPASEVISQLEAADVPVGLIYDVADMMSDPQYQARGMFEEVTVGGKPLAIPLPMTRTSGATP